MKILDDRYNAVSDSYGHVLIECKNGVNLAAETVEALLLLEVIKLLKKQQGGD